jgi:hypothetical protein
MVALSKVFMLISLMLMPLGMSAAMAKPAHHSKVAMMAGHCGEHSGQPVKPSPSQAADCAIACSMLMTAETRLAEPLAVIRLPAARQLAEWHTGLHPETATPPPKSS